MFPWFYNIYISNYSFTIIFDPEDDGGYSVYCPALPGCVSQGDTYDEALANIKEAVRGFVKSLLADGLPISACAAF